MPHSTYGPIDTDRILTTNVDLERRWKRLKAELDETHTRTARILLDTHKIVNDTKRVLKVSVKTSHLQDDMSYKP